VRHLQEMYTPMEGMFTELSAKLAAATLHV
jgi:hypothetical protein